MSSEVDYQILLGTYQQKSSELLSQTIALEARVRASNHQIDVLNKQVNDLIAELTIENSTNSDLLINLNSNIVNSNILDDNSGNQNLGFVISDKKVTFDERTTSVKKTKRFDSVKRNKSNGAF